MSNRRFQISNHHCRGFSLVLSISFNLVRFVQTSRFTFIIINWRFFSGCKSCRPVVLKRLPSGIFPPHLQIRIRISNRNSCTSSFSKGGMLELETSRRFYFFYFSKDLLHTYLASLYKGHVASSQIIIILRSKSNKSEFRRVAFSDGQWEDGTANARDEEEEDDDDDDDDEGWGRIAAWFILVMRSSTFHGWRIQILLSGWAIFKYLCWCGCFRYFRANFPPFRRLD